MKAHCVDIELIYKKLVLKEGQHGQFSKVKSKEAKIKHDIDVTEIINIELEQKVAKLLKENENLKRHYKELSDSIKTTRAKTIEHTTSLIAQNAEFKAQLQEKGFAIAALKLITTHYLPKERESAVLKPHHVIASSESRNSSKIMQKFSSNDMVHNHYPEEAKKKTQERDRNSRPNVMPSARSQARLMIANQNLGSITKTLGIGLHLRVKCVFNANHDQCVTKFLNEVNSRAKVPSNKTTNRNKPVEQTSFAKKPKRQIPKGHKFSIKKTSNVHEKRMTPRSCLRWKSTGNIFKTVGLRWVITGKIFTSSTTKVDSEPTNGSDEDITNQYEYEQTLNVSAGTLNLSAGALNLSAELGIHDHINEPSSSKLVPKVVPPADKITASR
nr:hypothetical protein [Tanacetum cinerariifolium]